MLFQNNAGKIRLQCTARIKNDDALNAVHFFDTEELVHVLKISVLSEQQAAFLKEAEEKIAVFCFILSPAVLCNQANRSEISP